MGGVKDERMSDGSVDDTAVSVDSVLYGPMSRCWFYLCSCRVLQGAQ